jgi:hypothetical protein
MSSGWWGPPRQKKFTTKDLQTMKTFVCVCGARWEAPAGERCPTCHGETIAVIAERVNVLPRV